MYQCNNCNREFEEPEVEETSYEELYGVASMFLDRHRLLLNTCPYCGTEDIREKEEDYGY